MADAKPPRWIEYVAIDDLPPDPSNPKAHADDDIDASLERFGYTEPVLLDERTGMLIAGHGRRERLIARRDSGKPIPDGLLLGEGGVWLAPVTRGWSSTDDAEASAYLVASNRLTEKGGWLADPLAALLTELRASDALAGTGYSSTDVDDLLASLGPAPDLDTLADGHGAPDDTAFWPTLRFKVSPDTKARYDAVVAHLGSNDAEHFDFLLAAAERTAAAV